MKHLFALLAFFSSFVMGHSAFSAERPNVLIIQTDEHSFRTLGCYRKLLPDDQAHIWGPGIKVETPHLDSIADRGAICTRFYATSPVCTPSRAAFVSGLYPQNTGAPTNDLPMLDSVETFAAALQKHGYDTGYAGKWHLDGEARPGWAPARQFGFADNRFMFNRGHWKKIVLDPDGSPRIPTVDAKGMPNYALGGADEKTFATDFLTDRTLDFIQRPRDGKPFCWMVSIPDPHGPNTVRPPYDTMFDHFKFEQPLSARQTGEKLPAFLSVLKDRFNAKQMSLYFGMVKCIDDNIGRILTALKQTGQLQNTVIVFTSDHGDMCGEHGRYDKGIPCEGSARIPFLIAAPGLIPPGTVIREALGTVDFKPTLLGLLGIKATAKVEGRDASALLRTGKAPADWHDETFVRFGASWTAIFTQRHKFVVHQQAEPSLFDLETDPFELKNILHDPAQRPLIRQLAIRLQNYMQITQEPAASSPSIQADLTWAISESPASSLPPRAKPARAAGKGSTKAKQKAPKSDP